VTFFFVKFLRKQLELIASQGCNVVDRWVDMVIKNLEEHLQ